MGLLYVKTCYEIGMGQKVNKYIGVRVTKERFSVMADSKSEAVRIAVGWESDDGHDLCIEEGVFPTAYIKEQSK